MIAQSSPVSSSLMDTVLAWCYFQWQKHALYCRSVDHDSHQTPPFSPFHKVHTGQVATSANLTALHITATHYTVSIRFLASLFRIVHPYIIIHLVSFLHLYFLGLESLYCHYRTAHSLTYSNSYPSLFHLWPLLFRDIFGSRPSWTALRGSVGEYTAQHPQ